MSTILTLKSLLSLIPSSILWSQLLFTSNNVGLKQLQRLVQLGQMSLAIKNVVTAGFESNAGIAVYHSIIVLCHLYNYVDRRPPLATLSLLLLISGRALSERLDVWRDVVPAMTIAKASMYIVLPMLLLLSRSIRDGLLHTLMSIVEQFVRTQTLGMIYFHPFIMYFSNESTTMELITSVYSSTAIITSCAFLS
jgi:hypothetical protein